MKKLAILILLSLFVLVGCQDDSSILAPTNDYASDELSKGRPILGLDGDLKYSDDDTNFDLNDDKDDLDPDKVIYSTTVKEQETEK